MREYLYKTILVPVESTEYDKVILEHILPLAQSAGAKLILFHVADGWAARYFREEADSPEVHADRKYLEHLADSLRKKGVEVEAVLGYGDPGEEIIKLAEKRHCDLIAMTTHGHRFISDLLYGSAVHKVRHGVDVPVLLVRAAGQRSRR